MGEFITGEFARQRWAVLLDQVDAAHQQMRNRGFMYRVFGQIADPPDETAMVPEARQRLSARLRIPTREVTRRFKMAARIRPRRQLVGPVLPPRLPVAAKAVAAGVLGEDHLRAITTVLGLLPSVTSPGDRVEVETTLVREAGKHDADFVTALGRRIDEVFNPDGNYNHNDRARRRGLTLSGQGADGMSRLSEGRYEAAVTDNGRLAWTTGQTSPQVNHVHHHGEIHHGELRNDQPRNGDPDPPPATGR